MLRLVTAAPSAYLGRDDVVDGHHPAVERCARELATGTASAEHYAELAFLFVRDRIGHSWDVQDRRVTVTASDVLREGVGLCYGKSHLLAALLRARGIPAGLCYQRLEDDPGSFSLHGLVAVHLSGRWSRLDPRGNKPGVDAQFSLEEERLAWPVRPENGEVDYADVLVSPDPGVVAALRGADDMLQLCRTGLPDRPAVQSSE